MRNSSWKGWFGAEVGFSIYIHRRGFTSSSTNSNQPSQLPPKARGRVRPARARRTRRAGSHQYAGQPHHAGALHPLVAGSIPAPAGDCGVRGPKRSTVARAVASKHGASDNARRPNLKPMRKPRPGSGPSAIPSTWRSSRHSGATSGARGSAKQLPGGPGLGSEPTHAAVLYPPHEDGGQELWRPAAVNRRELTALVVDANEVTTNSPPGATHGARWRCVGRGLWRFPGPRTPCVWVSPCYANTMMPKNRIGVQACDGGVGQPDRYAGAMPGLKAWRWAADARWWSPPPAHGRAVTSLATSTRRLGAR